MEFDQDSMRSGCTGPSHYGSDGINGEFSTGPRSVLSALLVARFRGPRSTRLSAGTGPRLSLIRDSLQSFLA